MCPRTRSKQDEPKSGISYRGQNFESRSNRRSQSSHLSKKRKCLHLSTVWAYFICVNSIWDRGPRSSSKSDLPRIEFRFAPWECHSSVRLCRVLGRCPFRHLQHSDRRGAPVQLEPKDSIQTHLDTQAWRERAHLYFVEKSGFRNQQRFAVDGRVGTNFYFGNRQVISALSWFLSSWLYCQQDCAAVKKQERRFYIRKTTEARRTHSDSSPKTTQDLELWRSLRQNVKLLLTWNKSWVQSCNFPNLDGGFWSRLTNFVDSARGLVHCFCFASEGNEFHAT